MPVQSHEVVVAFNANELKQLEVFASLHGVSVAEFGRQAILEAAHIKTSAPKKVENTDASWLTDAFTEVAETPEVETPKAPAKTAKPAAKKVAAPVESEEENEEATVKRGVVGEQSSLAKGSGPVWEIRKALGQQRLNGLGWTREHMAFVLKMSVVGVRKLEHTGLAPVKNLTTRVALFHLAKAIEEPSPIIVEYLEAEEPALRKLKAI